MSSSPTTLRPGASSGLPMTGLATGMPSQSGLPVGYGSPITYGAPSSSYGLPQSYGYQSYGVPTYAPQPVITSQPQYAPQYAYSSPVVSSMPVTTQSVPVQYQAAQTVPQAPPVTTTQQISATQQAVQELLDMQPIKGESRIEYVPYQREVTEYVTQEVVEYVPREKKVTDYYAVQYDIEYVPQVYQEKYVGNGFINIKEYVPVEQVRERVEYTQNVKQTVIQTPQSQVQQYATSPQLVAGTPQGYALAPTTYPVQYQHQQYEQAYTPQQYALPTTFSGQYSPQTFAPVSAYQPAYLPATTSFQPQGYPGSFSNQHLPVTQGAPTSGSNYPGSQSQQGSQQQGR